MAVAAVVAGQVVHTKIRTTVCRTTALVYLSGPRGSGPVYQGDAGCCEVGLSTVVFTVVCLLSRLAEEDASEYAVQYAELRVLILVRSRPQCRRQRPDPAKKGFYGCSVGLRLFYGCSGMFHLSGDSSRDRFIKGTFGLFLRFL